MSEVGLGWLVGTEGEFGCRCASTATAGGGEVTGLPSRFAAAALPEV